MGAVPRVDGVTFRVWAPFAARVAVAGEFNAWSDQRDGLAHDGAGYWSVHVPGASSGQQYQFVITTQRGATVWRIDPYAREVTYSRGNAVVPPRSFDWQGGHGPAGGMPPWNELVLYQLHVGSFHDVPGGGPGSFASLGARLDHLTALGVNALALLPAAEFPMDFSWGYNPSYPFAVESAYGGTGGLRAFVRAAHQRGLAVLGDVVYNHFGPNDLDLWRFDGWSERGGGGIYFYNDERARTPWGDTRPDYGRPEVRQYLRDNALYWLDELGLDGLRWDATAYIRSVDGSEDPGRSLADGWSLIQWIHREIAARTPWKISIAEDMRGNTWLTRPTSAGGAGFGSQWDDHFVHTVRAEVGKPVDEHRDVHALADAVRGARGLGGMARVVYAESHDEVAAAQGRRRITAHADPGAPEGYFAQKRAGLASALVLTSPGIPMLFMGQEFLEWRAFSDDTPLDWRLLARHGGIFDLHRDLIRLRRNWFDTTRGLRGPHVNVHHAHPATKVLAFHRWDAGGPRDDVVVVCNFANHAWDHYRVGAPRAGRWRVRFNSDWRGYSPLFGGRGVYDADAGGPGRDGMPWGVDLALGAYGVAIFSQDG